MKEETYSAYIIFLALSCAVDTVISKKALLFKREEKNKGISKVKIVSQKY